MADGKRTQECPICGSNQPLSARVCSICGAALSGEPAPIVAVPVPPDKDKRRPRYDPAEGDDDLYAGGVAGRAWRWVVLIGIVIALALGIGIGVGAMALLRDGDGGSGGQGGENSAGVAPLTPPGATAPRSAAADRHPTPDLPMDHCYSGPAIPDADPDPGAVYADRA